MTRSPATTLSLALLCAMISAPAGAQSQGASPAAYLTFDEGTGGSQVVAWVAVSPYLSHVVSGAAWTHYSFSRTLSGVVGAPPLRSAASASSMASTFRLG